MGMVVLAVVATLALSMSEKVATSAARVVVAKVATASPTLGVTSAASATTAGSGPPQEPVQTPGRRDGGQA